MKRRAVKQGLRIVSRVAIELLKPRACTVCGNPIKAKAYPRRIEDELHFVCPHCNNHLERENSRAAVRDVIGDETTPAQERSDEPDRRISRSVRRYVWRRDRGRCVQCGSQEKLEYDHIIPVAKGGSNTDRNVQLLCERCNRSKSARIM